MKNATNVPTEKASVVHKAMRQAAVVRRFSGMFQNVSHTADGVNQGFAIVAVNLAAQSINVNVHHIGGRIKAAQDLGYFSVRRNDKGCTFGKAVVDLNPARILLSGNRIADRNCRNAGMASDGM